MESKNVTVTYDGPTSRSDDTGILVVDRVRLLKGVPTQVSSELAEELKQGSDRLKGHKFSFGDEAEEESAPTPVTPPAVGPPIPGKSR